MISKIKKTGYNLLRKSEKYTKTEMVELFKNVSILTAGQAIMAGLSLILSIVFANVVPPETYGTYKFVVSIVGLLSIASLPGLATAVTTYTAKGFEGSLQKAVKTRIKWASIGSAASIIIAIFYLTKGNVELGVIFFIISPFVLLMEPFSTYANHLNGKRKFEQSTKYAIFSQLISFLSLLGIILMTENIFYILLGYFGPWTVLRYLLYKKIVGQLNNDSTNDGLIVYGKHLTLISILSTVSFHIDKVLLYFMLGPIQVATYSLAIAIPDQIKLFCKNMYRIALPNFSKRDESDVYKGLKTKSLKFLLFIILIFISYIFIAPSIYAQIFPNYPDSGFYSQIYSLTLITVLSFLPTAFLEAHNKTSALYKYRITSYIIQIALLFTLTYTHGLIGLIVARITGKVIDLIIIKIVIRYSHYPEESKLL